jgi:hypothetical protein
MQGFEAGFSLIMFPELYSSCQYHRLQKACTVHKFYFPKRRESFPKVFSLYHLESLGSLAMLGVFRPETGLGMVPLTARAGTSATNCQAVTSTEDLLVFQAYLATCSWVKHGVNPRQNQRRLIKHLRTILRDLPIGGMAECPLIVPALLRRSGCARTWVIARSALHPFGPPSGDAPILDRWPDCKSASVLEC